MTPAKLRQYFSVADTTWVIDTDSPEVLACAASSFPLLSAESSDAVDFSMQISVDERLHGHVGAAPVFRGRDHLVFARYADAGLFALDLRRRVGFAIVSPELAREASYWRESIFPVVLGLMCLVLEAVPLHSACIEYGGRGVLIAGRSGVGKSTLAATFARMGFRYVSDDWLYLSGRTGRVHAAPVNMKLMPEAIAEFFPELSGLPQSIAMNGELSVSLDPAAAFEGRRSSSCFPETIILLERLSSPETHLRQASAHDLVAFFSEPLDCVPACLAPQRARQVEFIRALGENRCYVLACGGSPSEIAATVLKVCDGRMQAAPAKAVTVPEIPPLDLLRRAVPTCDRRVVMAGGAAVKIDSDLRGPFTGLPNVSPDLMPDVHLHLLLEPGMERDGSRPPFFFSDAGLIGCSFGSHGCMLLDATTRFGIAFAHPALIESGVFSESLARILAQAAVVALRPSAAKNAALTMGAAL